MKRALMRHLGALWPRWRKSAQAGPPPVAKLNLAALEAHMKTMPGQVDIPVRHEFSGGIYLRTITIPAGALVMGRRHRGETCNILLRGKLAVYTAEDQPPVIIEGPLMFTTPPGSKKFAYCLEEAEFVNAFPTVETDIGKIEAEVIIPEEEYLQQEEGKKCLS